MIYTWTIHANVDSLQGDRVLSEDYSLDPTNATISKHSTSRSCPIKSMRAEWMGMAYMSGSRFFDQRKAVRERAIKSEDDTCQTQ